MFTSDQRALLEGKLDKANVKSRRGANGKAVAYLQAWHVIDMANEVFGFGNWDAETVEMKRKGLGGCPPSIGDAAASDGQAAHRERLGTARSSLSSWC